MTPGLISRLSSDSRPWYLDHGVDEGFEERVSARTADCSAVDQRSAEDWWTLFDAVRDAPAPVTGDLARKWLAAVEEIEVARRLGDTILDSKSKQHAHEWSKGVVDNIVRDVDDLVEAIRTRCSVGNDVVTGRGTMQELFSLSWMLAVFADGVFMERTPFVDWFFDRQLVRGGSSEFSMGLGDDIEALFHLVDRELPPEMLGTNAARQMYSFPCEVLTRLERLGQSIKRQAKVVGLLFREREVPANPAELLEFPPAAVERVRIVLREHPDRKASEQFQAARPMQAKRFYAIRAAILRELPGNQGN